MHLPPDVEYGTWSLSDPKVSRRVQPSSFVSFRPLPGAWRLLLCSGDATFAFPHSSACATVSGTVSSFFLFFELHVMNGGLDGASLPLGLAHAPAWVVSRSARLLGLVVPGHPAEEHDVALVGLVIATSAFGQWLGCGGDAGLVLDPAAATSGLPVTHNYPLVCREAVSGHAMVTEGFTHGCGRAEPEEGAARLPNKHVVARLADQSVHGKYTALLAAQPELLRSAVAEDDISSRVPFTCGNNMLNVSNDQQVCNEDRTRVHCELRVL